MKRKGRAVVGAAALVFFCVWSLYFGFRSERAPDTTIPKWSMYQRELPAGTSLQTALMAPLVRGQLVAAGITGLEQSQLMALVRQLDQGVVQESVCARLRGGSGQEDVWVYSARLSLAARLLHWQMVWARPPGVSLLGRHNGWPIWQLTEDPAANQLVYFAFADGMLVASMGLSPVGVFDLLDQYDGLIP